MGSYLFQIIVAIVGGILAASGLIIAKKPNAKELIDKITPYQGWIGVVLAIWGLVDTISTILDFTFLGNAPLLWILVLAIGVLELVVGILLGYGLISKYVLEKNETAKAKGEQVRAKLIKYQGPAGLALIAVSVILTIVILVL